MLKRWLVGNVILLLALGLCVTSVWAAKSKGPISAANKRSLVARYVANEVLIKFRTLLTFQDLKTFNSQIQASATNRQTAIAAFHTHFKTKLKKQNYLGWQTIQLPAGQTVTEALKTLPQNTLVEAVEPNYIVHADALSTTYDAVGGSFSDGYYTDESTQWWINRTQGDLAKAANFVFQGGNTTVVIAVLDTGVDLNHAEFTSPSRLLAGYNVITPAAQPEDDNTWTGTDWVGGHGTHVAGTIIANINNGAGIAGTSWDTRIQVLPVKVLDYDGSGTIADVADGIIWATDHYAYVINMSLGYYDYTPDSYLQAACNYAADRGRILIASAGNDGVNIADPPYYYPAYFSNVMAIAASDSMDHSTLYSNWSDPAGIIECMAPGGMLYDYFDGSVWWYRDFGITTTANNGSYSAIDGTSFASPMVAALAGLLWLQVPSRTADEIKNLILLYCDFIAGDPVEWQGAGRINIYGALSEYKTPTISPTPSTSETPTITPTRTSTCTFTPTRTHTPTLTMSPTPSITPTNTSTFTITTTFTISPTSTNTPTFSPTFTATPTSTMTPTWTPTLTHSPTCTVTPTPTPWIMTKDELHAYPQPARKQMTLAFNFQGPGQVTMELYNFIGERVIHLTAVPEERNKYAMIEILTQDLGPGIYFLRLNVEDKQGTRQLQKKIAIVK